MSFNPLTYHSRYCDQVPEPGAVTRALLADDQWHVVRIEGWPKLRYGLRLNGSRDVSYQIVQVTVLSTGETRPIAIERLADLEEREISECVLEIA